MIADHLRTSAFLVADGVTPWCIGLGSGGATGWPATDWVEDMTLRVEGPEYYDSWVAGETPFSDPAMQAIWTTILDLWNTPGAVFAAGGTIAATAFGANGDPLVAGDCLMHRQASFFSAFFPADTALGDASPGAVDVFMLPSDNGNPVLTARFDTGCRVCAEVGIVCLSRLMDSRLM